ncbi:MAG: flagellar biosynthesis regulator FlaF [Methylocystis sp.]|jgi:flagellar protein FlaF|nr:flagellar biosynthesis regulator FlaF [Methylocystis sp.]MCA3583392.1 flagellar biosynthesis regulator FlaF [Methylocystis sp.]MCA3589772.1 flagellar biosynthesis regulator FlaF [Methylocystis sp.]MCA3591911.1 flagellar biosynthesis regulator FlaF [Methylocystis sp.]
MNNPAQAYARTAQQTLQGRDLEAHVLLKTAATLQGIRDNWDLRQDELPDALLKNRKLWTVFVSAMSAEDCPMPAMLRSNIISLGMFIFNRTIQLSVDPQPQLITVLIEINRNVAAGLRGSDADKAPAQLPAA